MDPNNTGNINIMDYIKQWKSSKKVKELGMKEEKIILELLQDIHAFTEEKKINLKELLSKREVIRDGNISAMDFN